MEHTLVIATSQYPEENLLLAWQEASYGVLIGVVIASYYTLIVRNDPLPSVTHRHRRADTRIIIYACPHDD